MMKSSGVSYDRDHAIGPARRFGTSKGDSLGAKRSAGFIGPIQVLKKGQSASTTIRSNEVAKEASGIQRRAGSGD